MRIRLPKQPKIIQALIRGIQTILMVLSLTLVYFVGIGSTRLLAVFFKRKLLSTANPGADSFWSAAAGYESDMDGNLEQS